MNPAEPLTRTFCITVPSLFFPARLVVPGRLAPGPDLLGRQLRPEREPVPAHVSRNPAGHPEVGYSGLPVQPDRGYLGCRWGPASAATGRPSSTGRPS